ncbi:Imm63 family immunity protein [Pseudomonas carnis]|uniref:Imm63 family immunity protein n=1 Tax=Pseudomonas carnis TaxID=2487355 RepID=UPI0022AA7856|nr:Imm63 family immunity protein [Pseudomonas carnis]
MSPFVPERSYEIFRKYTRSLDELLFWIISRVALNMAVDYELSHRVAGKDSRRMIFEKYLSELSRINNEWGKKASDEIEAVLLAAPFSDS